MLTTLSSATLAAWHPGAHRLRACGAFIPGLLHRLPADPAQVVLEALRACSRSPEEQSEKREMDELQAGVEPSLATMALIYPKSASFAEALKPFHFSPTLQLQVWPFDLDSDNLVGWQASDLPLRRPAAVENGVAVHF